MLARDGALVLGARDRERGLAAAQVALQDRQRARRVQVLLQQREAAVPGCRGLWLEFNPKPQRQYLSAAVSCLQPWPCTRGMGCSSCAGWRLVATFRLLSGFRTQSPAIPEHSCNANRLTGESAFARLRHTCCSHCQNLIHNSMHDHVTTRRSGTLCAFSNAM